VVGIHKNVPGATIRANVTLRTEAILRSIADLVLFCRERIGYKAPEKMAVLDEMPLNPAGKSFGSVVSQWPTTSCVRAASIQGTNRYSTTAI
jgi:hypothetical protein